MAVQQWIDEGGLSVSQAVSSTGIIDLHRRFCEHLPEDLLWVQNPDTGERARVVAGELRRRDVKVGQHVAVSPGALARFLARFADVYGGLGKVTASFRPPPLTSVCSGCTRSSTATDAWPASCRTPPCSRCRYRRRARSIQRAALRATSRPTRATAACDQTRRNDLDGQRQSQRRSSCRIHALLSDHLPRSSDFHGRPDAAGHPAHAHPALGPSRSASTASRQDLAPYSRPCSTAANCPAATSPGSWVPVNDRPAAS